MHATIQLADLVLCAPEDLLSGWVPSMQRQVEPVQLARARNATQIDHGNLLVSYTFTVSRGHETYAAANEYLDDLPRACGRAFGDFTADRGLGTRLVKLIDAQVTFSPQPASGLRTKVQFTVTGALPPEIT
jgi:hypothetical protein